MKVILLQDVKNIGKRGDLKDVSDGYARNFLLKNKFAELATAGSIAKAEKEQALRKSEEASSKEKIFALAALLKSKRITLAAKGRDGKLFGAVGPKDISMALKKEGIDVADKSIEHVSLKKVGEKKVSLNLGQGIKATVTVNVEEIRK